MQLIIVKMKNKELFFKLQVTNVFKNNSCDYFLKLTGSQGR